MVDMTLVPEASWDEARRRAEVVRPLVESFRHSHHLVQAAAATLGLPELQTYALLRRCLSPYEPHGTDEAGRREAARSKKEGPPSAGRAQPSA